MACGGGGGVSPEWFHTNSWMTVPLCWLAPLAACIPFGIALYRLRQGQELSLDSPALRDDATVDFHSVSSNGETTESLRSYPSGSFTPGEEWSLLALRTLPFI